MPALLEVSAASVRALNFLPCVSFSEARSNQYSGQGFMKKIDSLKGHGCKTQGAWEGRVKCE
jgi:hypothetical protein